MVSDTKGVASRRAVVEASQLIVTATRALVGSVRGASSMAKPERRICDEE